jgi:hypothetical protein
MGKVMVGDDVWAFGLHNPALYRLIARFTVSETGQNVPGSPDAVEYGQYYFGSTPLLTNYLDKENSVEGAVRSLSIQCDGVVLGQCFQGGAAVRALLPEDRASLIAYVAALV